ncbi:ABC transporter permease [Nonomuraea sediminis]|uniref:ABC transporter permease n=1 Tax=Nonomuraea sediminis TaxID=2835864 RepID=UPI001BDC8A0D|nr:ABC transporter permease [Nonomuraea sediminis]
MALVRAELLKLTTTRLWWVMLGSNLLYAALQLGLTIGLADQPVAPGAPPLLPGRTTAQFQEVVWGLGAATTLFAMIIGVVMVTAEYRYQTITGTFLTTPRRERVVAAKLLAGGVVGVAFGLAVLLLTAIALVVTEALTGGSLVLSGRVARIAVGVLGVFVLYTLFGIGIGALVRNQVGAVLAAVGWVFLVESLVGAIPALHPVGRWTPGGAANAVTSSGVSLGYDPGYLLPAWGGAAVLLGYALVFAAVASVTTLRRDIT